jgi:hypothetical protein
MLYRIKQKYKPISILEIFSFLEDKGIILTEADYLIAELLVEDGINGYDKFK